MKSKSRAAFHGRNLRTQNVKAVFTLESPLHIYLHTVKPETQGGEMSITSKLVKIGMIKKGIDYYKRHKAKKRRQERTSSY